MDELDRFLVGINGFDLLVIVACIVVIVVLTKYGKGSR